MLSITFLSISTKQTPLTKCLLFHLLPHSYNSWKIAFVRIQRFKQAKYSNSKYPFFIGVSNISELFNVDNLNQSGFKTVATTYLKLNMKVELTCCKTLSTILHWSDISVTIVAMLSDMLLRTKVGPNTIARLRISICSNTPGY